MPHVEFADLKKSVAILDVVQWLNIDGLKADKDAFRGSCPVCKGKRVFVVTPGKGWYCHGCKKGGDIIKLVATVRGIEPRDAALAIQEQFVNTIAPRRADKPSVDRAAMLENVLKRLQPEHDLIQALGISPETAQLFESGFDSGGVLKGRYLVAIRSVQGQLVAFSGIAVNDEQSPRIAFSNFEPATALFNQHRLAEGTDLMLYRTPLDAILAVEQGVPIDSVTSFLTETVSPHQLELLAGLMDHSKIEALLL
jgi:hypothetical protein